MTNYTLNISKQTTGGVIVDIASASLKVVDYAAREASREVSSSEHEVSVFLAEVPTAGTPAKQLLQITADGETVADILKTRLAKVRKESRTSAGAPNPFEETAEGRQEQSRGGFSWPQDDREGALKEPDADGFTDGSRAGSPHESSDAGQVPGMFETTNGNNE